MRDYTSAFRSWDERASVRRCPRREIDPEDTSVHLFPQQFAPISEHKLINDKYPETVNAILGLHLVRYMRFTQDLELVVVNDTTRSIALGHIPFKLHPGMILDAHRLYCDEAYHALFSADIVDQVGRIFGITHESYVPSFLLEIKDVLSRHADDADKFYLKLLFVIISEMLITSNLKDVHRTGGMPIAVSDVMRDHAADESRHHAYYREVLNRVWPQLNQHQRDLWVSHMPRFISAFIDPDTTAILSELAMVGVNDTDAREVVSETYAGAAVPAYKMQCSTQLIRAISDLGILENAAYADIFSGAGYTF